MTNYRNLWLALPVAKRSSLRLHPTAALVSGGATLRFVTVSMIRAQANVEGVTIVTADRVFVLYDVALRS